jgi:outer membrane lipoprotein-sorting protein
MLTHSIRLFILMFCIALQGNAQNAKADILRINEAYSKFKDMSMNITYNVYLNYTAALPYETEVGFYRQHDNLRYSKLKEIESLQNKEYLIVTDNEQKRIVVANPVKFNPAKITLLNLDTALATCSAVNYLTTANGQTGYEMIFKSNVISAFDKIELYFSKKTYIVEKMVFFYRQKVKLATETDAIEEKPKLEISFSKFDFQKNTDAGIFSEKKFIEKNGGKYTASATYQGYQVIDQKFLK